ncbi:hypothetical protein AWH56_021425 [Anaerobacillus isosaccharinicus]|uniref:Uncharacterized protein n=1 Tax=Anaerobacillus isosaccharinicus TaxID=1532552 RepID=A0A1S2MGC5_9BACI|nr:hypothetical protein [Anaerobacillus isosaccharinicus]MBA5586531.1 hypothetical protein [Anaerobacillus isosaccharinicus]QOY35228.1 hypothetical protein AWH56_021425 [Anaerobacillus isosaccharinicus]
MNIRFLAIVSLKILAVYVVVLALRSLPMFISSAQMLVHLRESNFEVGRGDEIGLLFVGIIPFLILTSLGVLFWVNAEKISEFIFRKQQLDDVTKKEDEKQFLHELQIMIFSIVGLLVLIQTLPQLFNLIPSVILLSDKYGMNNSEIHTIIWLVGSLVQIGIGAYLFFGSKGLSGILKKIREL